MKENGQKTLAVIGAVGRLRNHVMVLE